MTKSIVIFLIVVLLACLGTSERASAQSQRTEHTFKLDAASSRPAATFKDVDMLVGSWEGTAFGSIFEETWNPPSAGSMVGFFKLIDEDEVAFYELLLLIEEEGSLSLKVKHFSAAFEAWEDKEGYVTFQFIKADENAVHFSGLSFYRIDENTMNGYIVLRSGEDVREEKLVYRRR
jgi:hypothetical protein